LALEEANNHGGKREKMIENKMKPKKIIKNLKMF